MSDQNYARNQKRVSSSAKTQPFTSKGGGVGEWYPPTRSAQVSNTPRNKSKKSSSLPPSNKGRSQGMSSQIYVGGARPKSGQGQYNARMQGGQAKPNQGSRKQPHQDIYSQSRKSIAGSKASRPRKKVRKPVVAAGIIVLIIVLAIVDTVLNWGKIMPGIKVGDLDVGGLTIAEAAEKIDETFTPCIVETEVTIYARDGVQTDNDAKSLQDELTQVIKAGNEPENVHYWTVTPTQLDVGLPAEQLANDAYAMARGLSGLPARIFSLFGYARIDVYGSYSPVSIEQFAQEIDQVISDPRIDYGVEIENGKAEITEGHAGYMVNRTKLQNALDRQFFATEQTWNAGVAFAEFFDLRITQKDAQETADFINNAIGDGVVFEYDGSAWLASKTAVGQWISVGIVEKEDGYALGISLNEASAKACLLSYIVTSSHFDSVNVSFENQNGTISVIPDRTGKMPSVASAVTALKDALFSENQSSAAKSIDGVAPNILVQQVDIPSSMSIETALESGIISKFSTYTTEYSEGNKNIERNYNIHLMSDLLNNSICKANGGVWSFVEVGGPSDEAHGFKSAGTIFQGEHVDSIGGGICQVATTVYNAIYEAGMRIVLRSNHSLYIASYPAGRDAAVSWPDMDFKWANDSASDVLVRMSYTDTTVTCDLYGVSPQYRVVSAASDWTEIPGYPTKYIVNNSRGSGYQKVTSTGQNARSIYVERTVYDREGNRVFLDEMYSSYEAEMEIIEIGPGAFADQMLAEGNVLRIVESTESE